MRAVDGLNTSRLGHMLQSTGQTCCPRAQLSVQYPATLCCRVPYTAAPRCTRVRSQHGQRPSTCTTSCTLKGREHRSATGHARSPKRRGPEALQHSPGHEAAPLAHGLAPSVPDRRRQALQASGALAGSCVLDELVMRLLASKGCPQAAGELVLKDWSAALHRRSLHLTPGVPRVPPRYGRDGLRGSWGIQPWAARRPQSQRDCLGQPCIPPAGGQLQTAVSRTECLQVSDMSHPDTEVDEMDYEALQAAEESSHGQHAGPAASELAFGSPTGEPEYAADSEPEELAQEEAAAETGPELAAQPGADQGAQPAAEDGMQPAAEPAAEAAAEAGAGTEPEQPGSQGAQQLQRAASSKDKGRGGGKSGAWGCDNDRCADKAVAGRTAVLQGRCESVSASAACTHSAWLSSRSLLCHQLATSHHWRQRQHCSSMLPAADSCWLLLGCPPEDNVCVRRYTLPAMCKAPLSGKWVRGYSARARRSKDGADGSGWCYSLDLKPAVRHLARLTCK